VLALEVEIAQLRAELDQVRREARDAVDRTHRQYRRDLVPVPTELLPARWRP
jgi:MerR family transcriptional regulator/heat shock protein HspR